MGNRKVAKKLRDQQSEENKTQTQEALAVSAEGKETVAAVEKLQEELENAQSMLKDVQTDKEELQEALDTAKSTEAEHVALLAKRAEEIATLTQDAETSKSEHEALSAELAESKKQVTALKTKVTNLKKQ